MEKTLEEVNYCKKIMKKHFNKPLKMTDENETIFQKATKCHICEKPFSERNIKVRDRCHITGKFGGADHQDCNLKLQIKLENVQIPVIFHNHAMHRSISKRKKYVN